MGEALQLVEGFRRLLSAPSGPTHSSGLFRPGIDFRGYAQGWWTLSWWRRATEETPPLEWETHPTPAAVQTTFSFTGASASSPHDLHPFNRARLLVDGAYALTFDLGVRTAIVWEEGAFRLEFLPRRTQMPSDGYHRQFEMHGQSGLYRLTAPASRVTPGQGVRLRVDLETPREGSVSFFMIKDRQDTLEVSTRTNAEQIAQLQEDVSQLRRTLSVLSRRLYPELYPERLRSREMVLYTHERAHCSDLDIALTEDGEVMLAFRLGDEHTAPGGTAVLLRSRAGGDVWRAEEAREVAAFPWPSDVRVTVFHRLGKGGWLLSLLVFHHYDRSGERMRAKAGDHETWLLRSADDGRTWTMDPQPLDPGAFPDAAVMSPAVRLPTGRLLMPAASCLSRPASAFLLASDDQGRSWRFHAAIGEIPSRYASNYPETTLTRARSGRLVAMIRVNEGPHLQSFSEDEGMTWTPWAETPMPSFGHRAQLITLDGGELLCTYGWRCRRNDGLDDPGGIRLAVSRDEGRTWGDARILRDDFLNWDSGYPVTLARRDGRLFTAYWGNQMDRFYIAGNVYDRWW